MKRWAAWSPDVGPVFPLGLRGTLDRFEEVDAGAGLFALASVWWPGMKEEDRAAHKTRIKVRFQALRPVMDERVLRLWAAAEAQSLGWGGVTLVSAATEIARSTISAGLKELATQSENPPLELPPGHRIRRPGAGRRPRSSEFPGLKEDLEFLVNPATRGDPESPLRWTSKSTRKLARELCAKGHEVSHVTVGKLLQELGYSLQGNRKTREGSSHPDRNAQFEHINATTVKFQSEGQPVISVDAKKKENLGDFHNAGREYQPKGSPEKVRTYDFPDAKLGKGIPYGVYDDLRNEGWVSVGTDHNTAEFAVETIRRWWAKMGSIAYPDATKLLITADGGGSNGYRTRLWPTALQSFADDVGLDISVCHFPPGTSKWNKIEHHMFSRITENWRGRPLINHDVIVNLIANTTTQTGLKIQAELDPGIYPAGKKVPDETFDGLNIQRDKFHGEWNYTVRPRAQDIE